MPALSPCPTILSWPTFPTRAKPLPVTLLVLVTVLGYLYLFDRPTLSHPRWSYSASGGGNGSNAVGNVDPTISDSGSRTGNLAIPDGVGKVERAPGDVVMVTASSGTNRFLSVPGIKDMVYENRMTYAERWGYEFMWANITSYDFGASIYWNKIPIMQEAFLRYPNATWIWWLDVDIVIMNMSLDVYDHVLSREGMQRNLVYDRMMGKPGGGTTGHRTPKEIDPDDVNFVISYDNWGINVGDFLMRRCEWSDWMLEAWATPLATAMDWAFPENDGFVHLWKNHKIVKEHTGVMNQRSLNAYPEYNPLGQHYDIGDFLVHFAGCGDSTMCPGEWDRYYTRREDYEVADWIIEEVENGTARIENVQKGDYLVAR